MIPASEFEEYFRAYRDQLTALAEKMLGDAEESSDVVQEVFAQLWEKQPKVKDGKIQNYLIRATYNRCLNRIKHEQKFAALREAYAKELKASVKDESFDREMWNNIQLFIQTEMPPRTREAFDLCYGEGLSYKEAAERMQVGTDAINKHIVTGLRLLRERFKGKITVILLLLLCSIGLAFGWRYIRKWKAAAKPETRKEQVEKPQDVGFHEDSSTLFFRNAALKTILQEIARRHGARLEYRCEEEIFLYVELEKSWTLGQCIDFLNHFDRVNLTLTEDGAQTMNAGEIYTIIAR